ncbi:signal peptidase I [Sinomonas cellulolyticus]|uniref:Signal peptidase I n=2 Tax=Sinomonas cellulolyticus TaxID=2801916 RepID=A0ABS1K4C8_9MICC|nr:signal peptidase I [Sinomonas cellulolyticus]GHG44304.1 signal peptidase I [Sinomonas sp. KCTC 49339]
MRSRHAGPESAGADPEPAGSDHTGRGGRKHSGLMAWLREIAIILGVAIVLSFLIKTFLFKAFYIPSESMVPTLEENDRIFVNLFIPRNFPLHRGDVVVFKDTKGWLPPAPPASTNPVTDVLEFIGLLPDTSQQHLIKRVIGLPGDHVVCCDAGGHLTVNGQALTEPYVNPAEVPRVVPFDVTVPEGDIWVMGDNRNHSADSRYHEALQPGSGFVSLGDVEGQAAVIAWPLNRIRTLDSYPDTFKNVPAPK